MAGVSIIGGGDDGGAESNKSLAEAILDDRMRDSVDDADTIPGLEDERGTSCNDFEGGAMIGLVWVGWVVGSGKSPKVTLDVEERTR